MAQGKTEQDKIIDKFVAERNKNIGEVIIPQVGEIPPQMECWYGAIMNQYCTTDLIRHYCEAIGDWRNPLWLSEDYARNTRWGGIIAPPTFTDAIVQPYAGKMATDDELEPYPFKSFFNLPNGTTRWLFRPIRPGDKFHVVEVDLGLTEVEPTRPAPARQFDDVIRKIIYNQRDEIVAINDRHMDTTINHDLKGAPFWGLRKRRRLTDQERDAIIDGYEKMKLRGADTLFWEEVKVGEEVWPLTVGPLSVYDNVCAYAGIVQSHAVAFDAEWQRIKRVFHFSWLDPEVNAWTCSGICHMVDGKGHADIFSGGAAVSFYFQIEGLLSRMLCNWMGDDGFLRKLDDRVPVLPIVGEVLCNKGKVTRKYVEGDEHLVDLDVWTDNLDGERLITGSATVRLASRTDFGKIK